jgi:hypothetical protein
MPPCPFNRRNSLSALSRPAAHHRLRVSQRFVPIQRELQGSVSVTALGPALGRLRLVSGTTLRIGSFQGDSSSKR